MDAEKCCFVPGCGITSSIAQKCLPNPKWFVPVPKETKRRMSWFASVSKPFIEGESNLKTFWCCNDHFNLDEDTETCVDGQGNLRSRLKYTVVPRPVVQPPLTPSPSKQKNVSAQQNIPNTKPKDLPSPSTQQPNKESSTASTVGSKVDESMNEHQPQKPELAQVAQKSPVRVARKSISNKQILPLNSMKQNVSKPPLQGQMPKEPSHQKSKETIEEPLTKSLTVQHVPKLSIVQLLGNNSQLNSLTEKLQKLPEEPVVKSPIKHQPPKDPTEPQLLNVVKDNYQLTSVQDELVKSPSKEQVQNGPIQQLTQKEVLQQQLPNIQVLHSLPKSQQLPDDLVKQNLSKDLIQLDISIQPTMQQPKNLPVQAQEFTKPSEPENSQNQNTLGFIKLTSGNVTISKVHSLVRISENDGKPQSSIKVQDLQTAESQPQTSQATVKEPSIPRDEVLPQLPPQMLQSVSLNQAFDSFFNMSEEAIQEKKLDELYNSVASSIPHMTANEDLSRNEILDEAISYIEQMRAKAHLRKSERAYLAAMVYQMKQKILEIEMLKERLEKGDITMSHEEFKERFSIVDTQPLVRPTNRRPKKRKKRVQ